VKLDDVRIHDLRHSFASEAVRQGISLPVISKLLGHSNLEMTMRYTHLSTEDIEAAAERIGQRIEAMFGKGDELSEVL
jgi:site-specific recombinase XerD